MINSSFFRTSLIILLLIACLVLSGLAWLLIDIPRRAERAFGPAARELGALQQLELSARLLLQSDKLLQPVDSNNAPRPFEVNPGESAAIIASRLEADGLISKAEAMRDYLVYAGLDKSLQTGKYDLSPHMSALEIAWKLQDATPNEVSFLILPGWRLEEIAENIRTSGLEFSPQTFLTAAYHPMNGSPILQEIPSDNSLEGFLFPDSYRFPRKISVDAFIHTILEDFDIKVDRQMRDRFASEGLSLYEAVTLASIIEREAVVQEEMPTIASVFFNRLNAGMKLDTDPTIQYALGYDRKSGSWWKNPLSLEDLQVNSPYNTYLNSGLPPGPISNPSLSALQAVAFPAETPYYYFRSACDGSGTHSFSKNFEEHQQKVCPD